MRKNLGNVAGILMGLVVAIGVALSTGPAIGATAAASAPGVTYESTVGGAIYLDDKTPDGGTCGDGSKPRCFPSDCTSQTSCPAKDSCSGALTCALYETVVNGGKVACRMLGECSPSSHNGAIVFIW